MINRIRTRRSLRRIRHYVLSDLSVTVGRYSRPVGEGVRHLAEIV